MKVMLLVSRPEEASLATAPCSTYACPSCKLTTESPIKAMIGGKHASAVGLGARVASEMGDMAEGTGGSEGARVGEGPPLGVCAIGSAGASEGAMKRGVDGREAATGRTAAGASAGA